MNDNPEVTPLEPTHCREILARVIAQWNDAGKSWDVEGLTNVYAEDALFFGGRPAHCVGADEIRRYFGSYKGVILSAGMELRDQHVVPLAPGLFLAQGLADFSFILEHGQRTQSQLRSTVLIERRQGDWKIRQYHFSPMPPEPPLGRS